MGVPHLAARSRSAIPSRRNGRTHLRSRPAGGHGNGGRSRMSTVPSAFPCRRDPSTLQRGCADGELSHANHLSGSKAADTTGTTPVLHRLEQERVHFMVASFLSDFTPNRGAGRTRKWEVFQPFGKIPRTALALPGTTITTADREVEEPLHIGRARASTVVRAPPLQRRVEHGDWSVSSCTVCNLSDSRTCWSWPRACARTSTSRATAIRVPDCYMASPSRFRYRVSERNSRSGVSSQVQGDPEFFQPFFSRWPTRRCRDP